MLPAAAQMQRTVVDGIPVFWADGPPPLRATLMFRVGRADEPLRRSGLTHLVEHLALWSLRSSPYTYNGGVALNKTMFWAGGTAGEVTDFLNTTVANLQDLPAERLELEKKVLTAEAEQRRNGILDHHLNLRYGAQGWGSSVYREFALLAATADELAQFSRMWFTRDNAALWISGPPPDGLSLSLPSGVRAALGDPVPLTDITFPCLAPLQGSGTSVTMTCRRSVAAGMAMRVAQRRATEKLRHEAGLVYHVDSSYEPMSANQALLGIWAEAAEAGAANVIGELYAILQTLAEQGPTEEELARCLDEARRGLEHPEAVIGMINRAVVDELEGQEFWDAERLIAEMSAVTPAVAGGTMREALATAMYVAPPGAGDKLTALARYPMTSPRRVGGRPWLHVAQGAWKMPPVLVSGDEGLTLSMGGSDATVRYGELAVCLRHPQGPLHLISSDAFRVVVNAGEWEKGEKLLAEVSSHVPPEMYVDLPADVPVFTAVNVPAGYVKRWTINPMVKTIGIGVAGGVLALGYVLYVATARTGSTSGPGLIIGTVAAAIFVLRILRSQMR